MLLAFRVDGERFALPASSVREVVRPPRTTRVPHAPESLIGLANLRGKVVPVVALGALLGRQVTQGGRVIILEQANPVGLLVDEISEMVRGGAADAAILDIDPLLAQAFVASSVARPAAPRAAAAATAATGEREEEVLLLSFMVGGQEYALPIGQVEEVARLPAEIVILPMSDAVVLGSVAHNGLLLPLLSLRLLLGLPDTGEAHASRVLIVRIGAQSVGLVVDAVQSMLRVAEDEIDAVPAVLSRGTAEARIQAICRLEGGKRLVSVLATDHLVRADLTGQLAADAREGETMERDIGESATEQFLVFRVGDQDFGMPIGAVREVTLLPAKLTRLPKAPAFVEGVMNLRGRPIPVIDQGRRFEGDATTGKRRRVIVAALGDSEAGFLVDTVSEVLRVPVDALAAAPDLANQEARLFDRVANVGDRILLIVEPQELLDRAERDLLAAMRGKGGAAPL